MMTTRSRRTGSRLAWLALALGAAWIPQGEAQVNATAAAALAEKHMCLACHKVDERLVGPGFREIAAKYANDPKAQHRLVEKVEKGGRGVWGNVPMPSNKDVPEDDIKVIVTWVLSLPAPAR